ncbi:hypothetical protein MHUMG1_06866 [Metarhizium humberi]|uniref:C6 finger domain protein n=1 Tax=Metarhizium humberi TaxID=2596975 RepID=A0A9P8M7E4_9HYPO|nr:hypothetical protein MHUMG1_06866 [Metarhizium humberi]
MRSELNFFQKCRWDRLICVPIDPGVAPAHQAISNNCARRRVACAYPARNAAATLILVERGKQKTATNWSQSTSRRRSYLARPECLTDQTCNYMSFFDAFTRANNFTGRVRTAGDEVKQLADLHSRKGSHLFNAILAVGAMYAGKLNHQHASSKREALSIAFQHYSYSIQGLREAIDGMNLGTSPRLPRHENQRVCILWTTFFLGVFELMNDATGHGWQQHIIHGTSMALKHSGPTSCRSGPGFAFFIQARIFEISRTILFNEPTFLTEPEWVSLSRDMLTDEKNLAGSKNTWTSLDSLLDIMVMCSSLCVRAEAFIRGQGSSQDMPSSDSDAMAISQDGHLLREALRSWSAAYIPDAALPSPSTSSTSNKDPENIRHCAADPSTLLARVFYASISIYLSGVFDYELPHWQRRNLPVPALDQATVAQHVCAILTFTDTGLNHTALSPVLFLFPLRIAGARSCRQWQRDRVGALLDHIGIAYAVASAIRADLAQVWKERAAIPNPELQFA